MAESTHSIYKTEFLKGKHSIDKKQHLKDLENFFSYYNEERYPFEFYGLTPKEVLNGEIPDKGKYKKQIKQAQKKQNRLNKKKNEIIIMTIKMITRMKNKKNKKKKKNDKKKTVKKKTR